MILYAIMTENGLMSTLDDIDGAFLCFLEKEKAEEAVDLLTDRRFIDWGEVIELGEEE